MGFMGKSWEYMGIPSGNLFQFANWKMTSKVRGWIPIDSMVDLSTSQNGFQKQPEGIFYGIWVYYNHYNHYYYHYYNHYITIVSHYYYHC